jgi:hypothetical protein
MITGMAVNMLPDSSLTKNNEKEKSNYFKRKIRFFQPRNEIRVGIRRMTNKGFCMTFEKLFF